MRRQSEGETNAPHITQVDPVWTAEVTLRDWFYLWLQHDG